MNETIQLNAEKINKIYMKIPIKENLYAVLIEIESPIKIIDYSINHNIYCINNKNEIIWQVQYPQNPFEEDPDRGFSDPFVYLGLDEDGKLQADKFRGNEYTIDIDTGIAEHTGYHR